MIINDFGLNIEHIPCVKCPNCAENGIETLVIRGKLCPICGTACS